MKIRTRMNLTFIPILLLTSGILCILFLYLMGEIFTQAINQDLSTNYKFFEYVIENEYPGEYKIVGNELTKGGTLLKQTQALRKLKESTAYEYTLFAGDTRILTTIESQSNLIGTKVDDEVIKAVLEDKQELIRYTPVDDKIYKAFYKPLLNEQGDAVGMIFTGVDINPYKQGFLLVTGIIFVLTIIMIIMGLIGLSLTSRHILKGIHGVKEHLNEIKNKKFKTEVNPKLLKRKDEMGELAQSLQIMKDELRDLLADVHEVSEDVHNKAYELSHSSQEIANVSQNISHTIQEVTTSTYEQAQDLTEVAHIIHTLDQFIKQMVSQMKDVNAHTDVINDKAEMSQKDIEHVIKAIYNLKDMFKNYVDHMYQFENKVNKVNEITQLIDNIAEQTNLLALNAAIEAARAGEAGRGFSVVAEEIRKLAEQSKSSANHISKLIESTSGDMQGIIQEAVVMDEDIMTQIQKMNQTLSVFKEILQSVKVIIPALQQVDEEAENIQSKNNIILNKIESASSIAEEVASSCEEVSASTENLSAVTQELSGVSSILNEESEKLKSQVNQFEL